MRKQKIYDSDSDCFVSDENACIMPDKFTEFAQAIERDTAPASVFDKIIGCSLTGCFLLFLACVLVHLYMNRSYEKMDNQESI